ncbi:RHS repeat-associated core domain-containing protein [Streptomyces californicus]|uniref:RHS repeat-associated core domain-containing protein n=1 Tax=Streptomyces californicus TaxID=67351 RepID=UPI003687AD9D
MSNCALGPDNSTATYSYGPYGETRASSGTNRPFRYTSTSLDQSGVYKMGARCYDPNPGRFTQPEPFGQEANPYLYAAGDPVNRTAPTGCSACRPFWTTAVTSSASCRAA